MVLFRSLLSFFILPLWMQISESQNPYQRAKQEWDERIGRSVIQARNWRFAAILALFLACGLLVLLFLAMYNHKDHVLVAEVSQTGRVINVIPLNERYNPTVAQQEYFICNFIELMRSLPLDPVLAKQNWLKAYKFLSQRAAGQLNVLLRQQNPLDSLGRKTVIVKINDINPISNSTFQVDWAETVFDISGSQEKTGNYSGVFTIAFEQPKSQQMILQNPLGIYITDFHMSVRG